MLVLPLWTERIHRKSVSFPYFIKLRAGVRSVLSLLNRLSATVEKFYKQFSHRFSKIVLKVQKTLNSCGHHKKLIKDMGERMKVADRISLSADESVRFLS